MPCECCFVLTAVGSLQFVLWPKWFKSLKSFKLSVLAMFSHLPWPPYFAGSSEAPALRMITMRPCFLLTFLQLHRQVSQDTFCLINPAKANVVVYLSWDRLLKNLCFDCSGFFLCCPLAKWSNSQIVQALMLNSASYSILSLYISHSRPCKLSLIQMLMFSASIQNHV